MYETLNDQLQQVTLLYTHSSVVENVLFFIKKIHLFFKDMFSLHKIVSIKNIRGDWLILEIPWTTRIDCSCPNTMRYVHFQNKFL